MSNNLVIVESPAKAKTIENFLGKNFKVASSYGHIADLPSKELGVNVDGDFSPKYIVSDDKKKIVSELKSLVKKADIVWIASDEDREGEAIAWHLFKTLKLNKETTKRIVFHEITKSAINKAIDNPREIDYNLVNAQQARRVLDRLVGYELSPVLWKKVKTGLSAGRVQSVAVRLIVERERKIKDFKPEIFYKTTAEFITSKGEQLKAQLIKKFFDSKQAKLFLESSKKNIFQIKSKETNPGKKSPTAPFTTSTLQQEASRKLYFSVSKTMTIAQKLYEWGLITYMRTDSLNLSKEAKSEIINQIQNNYGKEYLQSRVFRSKSKGAQEAHEAIRPTDINKINPDLEYDYKRLYQLIWKRTIASQMSDAKLERTQLKIFSNNGDEYISKGEVILFDGFLKVYSEGVDDQEDEEKGILPHVNLDEKVNLNKIISTERQTRPPYRYAEASLVKKMEELGIGRPSTYAPTISTVQNRGYIIKGNSEGLEREYQQFILLDNKLKHLKFIEKIGSDKGKLVPTDIGIIVNDFLVNNFKNILDYNFTAKVEEEFDEIADGKEDWTKMIKDFYSQFNKNVNFVNENATRESGERVLGIDPSSGREVKVRLGKYGPLGQIGNSEDDEKPIFTNLAVNQKLETITLEEVLDLFKLPKEIGVYENEVITINNGRFGPYIKFGKKFISIPKGENPLEFEFNSAVNLIEEKKKADAPIFVYKNLPVTKGVGRFGPFIKWDGKFINVNKKYDYNSLKDKDIETLIEEKLKKDKEKIINHWEDLDIKVEKGRWGRSLIFQGKLKIEINKEIDATKLNLEQVKQIIQEHKGKNKVKAKKKKN